MGWRSWLTSKILGFDREITDQLERISMSEKQNRRGRPRIEEQFPDYLPQLSYLDRDRRILRPSGILFPDHPTLFSHLKALVRSSSILRTVILKIREEIFRKGITIEPRFLAKCGRCGYESMSFHYVAPDDEGEEKTCPACEETHDDWRQPSPNEREELEKWLRQPVNSFGQLLTSLVREIEDDLNIYDDGFLLIVKQYRIANNERISGATPVELVRLDPARVRIIVGPRGDIGGYWRTCVIHRHVLVPISESFPHSLTGVDRDPTTKPASSSVLGTTEDGGAFDPLYPDRRLPAPSRRWDLPTIKHAVMIPEWMPLPSDPSDPRNYVPTRSEVSAELILGEKRFWEQKATSPLARYSMDVGRRPLGQAIVYEDMAGATECPECSLPLHPVEYVLIADERSMDIEVPFVRGEIIHVNKYEQNKYYGYPPVLSVWYEATTLYHMSTFMYDYYVKRRIPRGLLTIPADNIAEAQRMKEAFKEGLHRDPLHIPILAVPSWSSQKPQFIRLMDTPQEMNYIDVRDELRQRISALYGVANVFMADTSTGGGLNNEGMQIVVTNRAVESGQRIWNEIVFPRILQAMGMTDWIIRLPPPEEKDEMAPHQRFAQQVSNAEKMLALGFEVKYDPDRNEFRFSGEPMIHPNVMSTLEKLQQMGMSGMIDPTKLASQYGIDLQGMGYQNPRAEEGPMSVGSDQTGEGQPRSGDSDCIEKRAAELRSQHPDWTEEQVRRRAEHLCGRDQTRRPQEGAASTDVTSSKKSQENQVSVKKDHEIPKKIKTVDDCVKFKIPIIAREHPDWDKDQVVAVAYSWCRDKLGKKKK